MSDTKPVRPSDIRKLGDIADYFDTLAARFDTRRGEQGACSAQLCFARDIVTAIRHYAEAAELIDYTSEPCCANCINGDGPNIYGTTCRRRRFPPHREASHNYCADYVPKGAEA